MTEFEKWDNGFCGKTCPLNNEITLDLRCSDCIITRKSGWKAALEWVQKMFITNKLNPPPTFVVPDEISQELKQLNQSNSQSDNSNQSDTPSH